MWLKNDLGYGLLLNTKKSFKLALMCEENHLEDLFQYLCYFGQGLISSHSLK